MKRSVFICMIFCGLAGFPLRAQTYTYNKSFYGLGASYPWGIIAGGGNYNRNGWGKTLSLNVRWTESINAPAGYKGGGFWHSDNPKDFTLLAAVRALKEIPSGNRFLDFGVEAGGVLVSTSVADQFQQVSGIHLFSSNYTYKRTRQVTIGISLKGKLDWKISDRFNLELGLGAAIGKDQSYYGVDLIGTVGRYR